ncbi:MAG TPA: sigma-70 family RNA polymerase sigma factor [Gaiellaceae bacterium]
MRAGRSPAAPGEAELLQAHRGIALGIAAEFFLPGSDADDVRQEAMIGLLYGIRDWDPERGPLRPWLMLVVRKWLNTAVKAANRGKHLNLVHAVREVVAEDGDAWPAAELIPDPRTDALEMRATLASLLAALPSLSPLEREALTLVVNGYQYKTGPADKHYDNALQRARRKLLKAAA